MNTTTNEHQPTNEQHQTNLHPHSTRSLHCSEGGNYRFFVLGAFPAPDLHSLPHPGTHTAPNPALTALTALLCTTPYQLTTTNQRTTLDHLTTTNQRTTPDQVTTTNQRTTPDQSNTTHQ